jgi:peptide/nickel transport system substrate-binding protein
MSACGPRENTGADDAHSRALTISTPADADALLPLFVQSTQGKQAVDLLFDHLARPDGEIETVGDSRFRAQLAKRWVWSPDSLAIAFELDPSARWHDGKPVTASDVRFSFALYTDSVVASPIAGAFEGIDSVSVRDSLTAIVWWSKRNPEQFFQVAYNLAVMPEHLLANVRRDSIASSEFARKPVGSGRYRFEQWTPRSQLVFAADTMNYRGRPQFARVIWVIASDPTAAGMRILSGEADLLEQLRDDVYEQATRSPSLKTVEYGSYDYAYMLMNHEQTVSGRKRFFADHAVRVALTKAIDRRSVVNNALGSLGQVALGPMTRAEASVNPNMRQIEFDTAGATRALDSLGWTRTPSDGLRRKGGRVLEFEILVPASSNTRKRIAVLLQEQLRRVGVSTSVAAVEPGVFFAKLEKGEFDAALNMWRSVPGPTSLKEVWGTRPMASSAPNFGHYSHSGFDALLDSASQSYRADERAALLRRAHQVIVDDAAAIWLYEPRNVAAMSRHIEPVGMRADAWWAEIPDWKVSSRAVAANER